MALNLQQKEMIAGLPQYPAFSLLMQLLKDELRHLESQVFAATTPDETVIAVAHWKAFKYAHDFISTTPENLVRELEDVIAYRETELGGLPDDYRQNNPNVQATLDAQWFGWGNRPVDVDPEEEESFR